MTSIQSVLINEYEKRRDINSSYSYRAFAKKLGISSGSLSSIIKGERKISKKMASRLAVNLGLEDAELTSFFESFSDRCSPNQQVSNLDYVVMEMSKYQVISEGHHFAILSLLNTDDFRFEYQWIASRLGISVLKAESAIKRMLTLGMLKLVDGVLTRAESNYSTSDDILNLSLQKAHQKNLELASKAIVEVPVELRDISAMTMAIDVAQIDEAKKRIRKFQDELAELLESGEKKEVYKLNVQLFPLTK
ncbi:MAG: hypothetical protein BM556_12230 [Bacteriovorax sp. MedPE-SWde]|nr:MAG: hypothetical protein BM556_12230 [Bacteriovorax sp. MedPE-SWde]